MDISTQHCAEGKTKVLSFLFRCVGHILYILIPVHSRTILVPIPEWLYSARINGPWNGNFGRALLDCPRSGPGPVQPLFADPGPGPGPVLDLDPRSGPGPVLVWTWTPVLQCNYFLFFLLFVINIHIYIIIQKFIFLICALPNSLRPNFQLIFQNYESVDLLTFILSSK